MNLMTIFGKYIGEHGGLIDSDLDLTLCVELDDTA